MRGKLLLFMLLSSLWVYGQVPHTVTFSGASSDFNASEKIFGGDNVDYYVTYDATYIYFGAFRVNGATWGSFDHYTIYFDTDPQNSVTTGGDGSTTGVNWDSNTPTLPIQADFRAAIRRNNFGESFLSDYDDVGSSWSTGSANAPGWSQFADADGLEIRIPWSDLGSPNGLYFTMYCSFNGGFFGANDAGYPISFSGTTFSGYFGGIGTVGDGFIVKDVSNQPIIDSEVGSSLLTGAKYSKIDVNSSVTIPNNVTLASGGVLELNSGTLTIGAGNQLSIQDGGKINENGGTVSNSSGKIKFEGEGTISGTVDFNDVEISGGVNFGTNSTISDTLRILTGGSALTNAPIFNSNSTLTFATGGSYDINSATVLWTTGASVGQGVPNNVYVETTNPLNINEARDVTGDLRIASGGAIVQGNNSFTVQGNFDNLGTYSFVSGAVNSLTINGNFVNNSGASMTLSDQAGGDMQLSGNFTDNGGFTSNDRAVFFVGSAAPQTINASAALIIDFLQINNANGVNLNQSLTVNDDLTLTAGTLDLNGNSLTLNGSLQRTSGLISASATNSTLVLDNSTSAISLDNTFFDGNLYNVTVNGTGATVTNDINVDNDVTVGSGATLTINSGHTLNLDRDVINNGTITVNDNASLVQTAVGDNNSGTGTYDILRTTDVIANPTRFNYWSSPVASTTMDAVFGTGSGSLATNSNDWYTWDENGSPDQWVSVAASDVLTPGKGYITTGDQDGGPNYIDTRTFSGSAVNNGAVNLSVTAASDDYILVGNPYPSAISSSRFVSDNPDLTGTLHFWDHVTQDASNGTVDTNAQGDYASWNLTGTAGNGGEAPDNYVQSCQGFFVRVNATASVSQIVFENDQREVGNNAQFFKAETRERLWLNLTADYGEYNQILVGLVDQATDGYDQYYDGAKLKGNPSLAFYSMINWEELAIQALDKNLTNNKFIPLGVDAWKTGQYTIALDSLNNWQAANYIYLLDSAQRKIIDLKQSDYSFAVNQIGVIHNRFYLMVGQDSRTNVSLDESGKSGELHYFQREGQLILNDALSQYAIKGASLLNLGGAPVLQSDLNSNDTEHQLNVGNLANGIYMLQVEAQDGALHTYKVYLR